MKLAVLNDDDEVVDSYDLDTDDAVEAIRSLDTYGPYDSVPSFNPVVWEWIKQALRKAEVV